jgi:hypothetical protein
MVTMAFWHLHVCLSPVLKLLTRAHATVSAPVGTLPEMLVDINQNKPCPARALVRENAHVTDSEKCECLLLRLTMDDLAQSTMATPCTHR